MALSLDRHWAGRFIWSGTLAQVPLLGGAPREILEDVQWADWGSDGASLAVVRRAEGKCRIEYPIGNVLFETAGWASHLRVSPDGERVAFLHHPALGDDGGAVMSVERASGRSVTHSDGWITLYGLAWRSASEIWFTATRVGVARSIWSVLVSGGRERLLARTPGELTIQDIARDGRTLMTSDNGMVGIIGARAGEEEERDLSLLDWSLLRDITPDGKLILFDESGEGGGAVPRRLRPAHRRLSRGAARGRCGRQLLPGRPLGREPEGRIAAAGPAPRARGRGSTARRPRPDLPFRALRPRRQGHPDRGQRGRRRRPALDLSPRRGQAAAGHGRGRRDRPLPGVAGQPSRRGPDLRFRLAPRSRSRAARPTRPGARARRSAGGVLRRRSALYGFRRGELPGRLFRLDLANGSREVRRELRPRDPSGVVEIVSVVATPDGTSYAYSQQRILSDLFLVNGVALKQRASGCGRQAGSGPRPGRGWCWR